MTEPINTSVGINDVPEAQRAEHAQQTYDRANEIMMAHAKRYDEVPINEASLIVGLALANGHVTLAHTFAILAQVAKETTGDPKWFAKQLRAVTDTDPAKPQTETKPK